MAGPRRALASSAQFIWDFLVGDTPEVLVTVAVMVAIAFSLRSHQVASVIVLPLICLSGLVFGVWRASGRRQVLEATGAPDAPEEGGD
ncbi:MAG: hypothetical protein ABSA65_11030 [Acidimicrobiales bacterium]|jgi:hypothetical protein